MMKQIGKGFFDVKENALTSMIVKARYIILAKTSLMSQGEGTVPWPDDSNFMYCEQQISGF